MLQSSTFILLVFTFCLCVWETKPFKHAAIFSWDEIEDCTVDNKRHSRCKIPVYKLRPTQYAYGPHEVKGIVGRQNKQLVRNETQLEYNNCNNVVPVAVAPWGQYFVTDGHHHCVGTFLNDAPKTSRHKFIHVRIQQNAKHTGLNEVQFWQMLLSDHHCWYRDNKGIGPIAPNHLPNSFNDLIPDFYRDLAKRVHSSHYIGAQKTGDIYYFEFKWGDFLRNHIPLPRRRGLSQHMQFWCNLRPYLKKCLPVKFNEDEWLNSNQPLAIKLATSPLAKDMPGFFGPRGNPDYMPQNYANTTQPASS